MIPLRFLRMTAAFRVLKSELSIRPIFHQLERRAKALGLLGTLVSADIVLPTTDGREIRLRRVTTPSEEQKRVLDLLGLAVPQRLSFDKECSADSAIA